MADIWLTAAAQDAFSELRTTSPEQAHAVTRAINEIPVRRGQPIDLPGAPSDAPFLAREPADPDAPVVIYRRTTIGEDGDWLVVSLMKRGVYRSNRRAERELADSSPAVQNLVRRTIGNIANTAATSSGVELPEDVTPDGGAARTSGNRDEP
jgi:hypothetical protein